MTSAGYSGKPLYQKLGLKPGMRYLMISPPEGYEGLIADSKDVRLMRRAKSADVVHLFCRRTTDLTRRLAFALGKPVQGGMLWISWPKKSSPLFVDLTENMIRSEVLKTSWVDVKVCAVDQDWSGLKFLRRRPA